MKDIKILKWLTSKKENIIDVILIFSAILTIWSYLRIIPIIIFAINIIFFKRHLRASFIFFSIAIGITIIGLLYKPIIDKEIKEFTKQGFNENFRETAQKDLDVLFNNIYDYKNKCGHFPRSLLEMKKNSPIHDVSYNKVQGNLIHPMFYYEIIDSNEIYLSAIGKDGKPKTHDDILPIMLEKK